MALTDVAVVVVGYVRLLFALLLVVHVLIAIRHAAHRLTIVLCVVLVPVLVVMAPGAVTSVVHLIFVSILILTFFMVTRDRAARLAAVFERRWVLASTVDCHTSGAGPRGSFLAVDDATGGDPARTAL